MRSSSRSKLVVELENGETAQFQKRDGLQCGDNVWVGYDVENLKYNHIIRKQHTELQENMKPVLENKPEQVHEYPTNLAEMSQVYEDSHTEETEEDYFEDMRILLQDFEDDVSSAGE